VAKAPPAPALPFAPDQIVICLESHHTAPHFYTPQGARLRASSEVVRLNPLKFIADGATDQERFQAVQRSRPVREVTQHIPITRPPTPLEDEDAVLCIRNVRAKSDGDVHLRDPLRLAAGTRVRKDHPLVAPNRDAFVPVAAPGLIRSNALRAKADLIVTRRGPDGEYIQETNQALIQLHGGHKRFLLIHKGQWAARDDPMVKEHAGNFEEITS
jgi:hypothetical protein